MERNLENLIAEHSKYILEYSYDSISTQALQYFYNLWKMGKKVNRTSFILYLFPELENNDTFIRISSLLDLAINVADNLTDELLYLSPQEKLYHFIALSIALENLEKYLIGLSKRGIDTQDIPTSLYSNLRKLLLSEAAYKLNNNERPSDLELYLIRALDIKPFVDLAKLFKSDIDKYEKLIILIRAYSLLIKDYADIHRDEERGIETPLTRARRLNRLEEIFRKLKYTISRMITSFISKTEPELQKRVMRLLKEIENLYGTSIVLSAESE